jgi:hypothetical protein
VNAIVKTLSAIGYFHNTLDFNHKNTVVKKNSYFSLTPLLYKTLFPARVFPIGPNTVIGKLCNGLLTLKYYIMKKVLITLTVATMIFGGCKKNENEITVKAANSSQADSNCYDRTKGEKAFAIPAVFDKSLFQNEKQLISKLKTLPLSQIYLVLDAKKDFWADCPPSLHELIEDLHSLHGDKAQFEYLQRRDSNNPHPNYRFASENWSDVMNKFEELGLRCNNGWMEIIYHINPDPTQDDTVSFSTSTLFDLNDRTFYTHILFKGIDDKIKKAGGTPTKVYFTKAYCPITVLDTRNDLSKIIFKVEYVVGTKTLVEYYDMSDYPM